jgi:hypothetical protein
LANQNKPMTSANETTIQTASAITNQSDCRAPLGALVVAATAALALVACSGGHKASPRATAASTTIATRAPRPTTTTVVVGKAVVLALPTLDVAKATSAAGTANLDRRIARDVTAAVRTYLNLAVGAPLGTGHKAAIASLLTANARARLTARTRNVLVDEGLVPLGAIKADRNKVALDAFYGPDGGIVVNAALDVQVNAKTAKGQPVRVVRRGTLTYVIDANRWRIDSFDLNVERDLP